MKILDDSLTKDLQRKILSDIECMSGTGWYYEDNIEMLCLECEGKLKLNTNLTKGKCKCCGKAFTIEYGKMYLRRIREVE